MAKARSPRHGLSPRSVLCVSGPRSTLVTGRLGTSRGAVISTLVAAALASSGCAGVQKDYRVSLAEPERLEAIAQVRSGKALTLRASDGQTVEAHRVIELTDGAGKQQRLTHPLVLNEGILDSPAPVVLVLRPKEESSPEPKKKVGPIVAFVGLGVAAVGALLVLGAVGVAGPANDTSKVGYAGGVVFGVGTAVAITGGIITLVESNPRNMASPRSPWETVDLGAVRVVR